MPIGNEVGLGPGHIVLDGDLVGTKPLHSSPPTFRPMSIVTKRSPISATAELLYKQSPKNAIIQLEARYTACPQNAPPEAEWCNSWQT